MEDLVVDLGERSYPIIIKKGLIDEINLEIKKIYTGKKVFILTDKNVDSHYGNTVKSKLVEAGYDIKLTFILNKY